MKTVLSIAGSDSCGGAGIQADIKTMTMNGVYGMCAITALTAQNTTGVRGIQEASTKCLQQQLEAVFRYFSRCSEDRNGILAELIQVIAESLKFYRAKNIVVDPVMVATSGSALLKKHAVSILCQELLPLATLATPNIPEAQILSDSMITNPEDMKRAAQKISTLYGCAVLIKGGHSQTQADDLLYAEGTYHWFPGKRIEIEIPMEQAVLCLRQLQPILQKDSPWKKSVWRAKEYISGALAAMLDLGKGSGPMQHNFNLEGYFTEEASY